MIRRLRNWVWAQRSYWKWRRRHNDRDHRCTYWWGDRGGYDLRAERCPICNPEGKP